ncbi:MAG: class I SAM-dependent methyltransferase [Bacteroidota bacterium]|nr:class I SAM-dependent methyltransferase [Bacteroidota bacterium]
MQYDPIKRTLGAIFDKSPRLRIVFYKLLNLLLLRTWHIKKEVRKIKKSLPESTKILDAGAGFGQYTYYLSRQSSTWDIHAVDIKQEQIDDCNIFFKKIGKANQVRFEYADLTTFNKTEEYDLALSVDVMEHIEEDELVFQNLYRALKSGGTLLISTPSDKGGSDVHHDHDESFIEEHVRDGYNMQDIERKLTNAGFTSVHSLYSYGTPGKISWKISMKYPILLLNKSKLFFILLPFYYLISFPFSYVLNLFDVHNFQQTGTGLIVTAKK